jgi:ribosome assembly protein 1
MDLFRRFESSIVTGFQIATSTGPLCAEPMVGVCYFIEDFTIDTSKVEPTEGIKEK